MASNTAPINLQQSFKIGRGQWNSQLIDKDKIKIVIDLLKIILQINWWHHLRTFFSFH